MPLTLAILVATPTPYFTHYYTRIARELPDVRLVVTYTHMRQAWPVPQGVAFEQHVLNTVERDSDWSLKRRRTDWRLGRRVIAHLESFRPDVLYLASFNSPDRLRVISWAKRRGIPVILWSDANLAGSPPGTGFNRRLKERIKHRYFRWLDRRCAGWLGCGSESINYYTHYGVARDRIDLAPPEPDYDLVQQVTPDEMDAACRRYGVPPGRKLIFASGRLVRNKRFDRALAAFFAVADDRPDFDLVVAGTGPLADDLRASVPERLRDRVHFTGFIEDTRTYTRLYRRGDVLLHAAEHEPWGLIVNEAAASGMALVCTRVVGAAVEIIRDGVNGRLVPSGDADALANALREVTAPEALPAMQAASPAVLADWRAEADPIDGLRRTLARVARPALSTV